MSLVTRAFPVGSWGIDCSVKLSPAILDQIARTPLPNGKPCSFVIRYAFFRAPGPASDLDAAEAQAIWERGLGLSVVIHPRVPKANLLSADVGLADAAAAIKNCIAAGYDPARIRPDAGPPWLSPDIEGVLSAAPTSADYLRACAQRIASAQFRPAPYLGYQTRLTAADLSACPGDPRWWADFEALANHPMPACGFSLHQHPQVTWCGIQVDPDEVVGDGFVAVVDDGTATQLDGEPAPIIEAPPSLDEGDLPPAAA